MGWWFIKGFGYTVDPFFGQTQISSILYWHYNYHKGLATDTTYSISCCFARWDSALAGDFNRWASASLSSGANCWCQRANFGPLWFEVPVDVCSLKQPWKAGVQHVISYNRGLQFNLLWKSNHKTLSDLRQCQRSQVMIPLWRISPKSPVWWKPSLSILRLPSFLTRRCEELPAFSHWLSRLYVVYQVGPRSDGSEQLLVLSDGAIRTNLDQFRSIWDTLW